MRQVELVVVGGGVVGAATAWWAAKQGVEVVLLERFGPGHAFGSSHGGVRIFRVAYPQADYVALAREALELWREVEDETGDLLLELTGGIDCGDPAGVQATAAALRAAGIEHELLGAVEATERFGGFHFEGDVLFQPQGGRCWAARSVAALARSAAAQGAELRHGEPVERIVAGPGGRLDVHTGVDSYRAGAVVLAAGAWLDDVLAATDLGPGAPVLRTPALRVTVEQPAHFAPTDPALVWPSFIEHGAGRAFDAYGLFEPGVGLKLGEHMVGPVVHPDRRRLEPDPDALARLCTVAARLLPGVRPEPVAVDTCLYTTTPTEDFVIDRRGALTVASACSGHGFKFGPATGRLVAEVALGRRPAPSRFALPG